MKRRISAEEYAKLASFLAWCGISGQMQIESRSRGSKRVVSIMTSFPAQRPVYLQYFTDCQIFLQVLSSHNSRRVSIVARYSHPNPRSKPVPNVAVSIQHFFDHAAIQRFSTWRQLYGDFMSVPRLGMQSPFRSMTRASL